REPLGQEAVAPLAKLGSAQEGDRLAQDRAGQVNARVLRVVGAAAAREQIFFVERKRFTDGDRAAFIVGSAGLPPGERASRVHSLPIVQDAGWGGRFEIVRERKLFDPLGTAVGDADAPRPCSFVAPVAQVNAWA